MTAGTPKPGTRGEREITELLRRLELDELGRRELLKQALTHSSCSEVNNERLELLGDAVLKLAVSHWLYLQYPHSDEGKLSALRGNVVSDESLAQIAAGLELGEYLYMGAAEERDGGRAKPSLLACALEAIFGAIYLSEGLVRASEVVITVMADALARCEEKVMENYKDRLQEWTQGSKENKGELPFYEVVAEEGPPNNRVFHCAVKVYGIIIGHGRGRTKKAAEQEAARNALVSLPSPQAVARARRSNRSQL